jgi:hypothetical protein
LGVVMDVASWLLSLGLEQYEAVFRKNEIDESVLPRIAGRRAEAVIMKRA